VPDATEVAMDVAAVLTDLYGRIPEQVHAAVRGLSAEELATSPEPGCNTIGWLVWHLTRVQDAQIADLMDVDQVWTADGWATRFGRDPDPADTGYGHTRSQMESVRPDGPEVLLGYFDATWARTREFLQGLTPGDLDRVVDERWDPPVTLGVRLVSIADDDIAHAGQAAYVRGMLLRRRA